MLPTLEQLKGSSLQAAITLSLVSVGKTEEEISAAMGWSAAQHARFFRSHDFWPALPNLPRYCSIVGNHVLALWIIANAEFVVEQCQPMDAITLFKRRIQLASATPSKLNEKARWYSPLASPSNQRLRGVWAMHTLPGKNGTTSARQ